MMNQQRFLALVETGTSDQILSGLEALVLETIGAVIFSCSTFDLTAGKSRRFFTNLPDIYPVAGLKDIVRNRWTAQVLDRKQTFVANKLEEIREVFPDHAIIESLGCGSVINMPVFLANQFLGTVNILHKPGYYSAARQTRFQQLRPEVMLAFASRKLDLSAD